MNRARGKQQPQRGKSVRTLDGAKRIRYGDPAEQPNKDTKRGSRNDNARTQHPVGDSSRPESARSK